MAEVIKTVKFSGVLFENRIADGLLLIHKSELGGDLIKDVLLYFSKLISSSKSRATITEDVATDRKECWESPLLRCLQCFYLEFDPI